MSPPKPDPVVGMPRASVRTLVSVLVALHIFAVFVGPWAMAPASDLASSASRVLRPYLEFFRLTNGYRFFAPEPGPSHLVRYEVTLPDGSVREGKFPDRNEHMPRLRYHRHFMLTEFVNTLSNPQDPRAADAYAKAYAQHVLDRHSGKSVKMFLVRHYVPRMGEVRQGIYLTDKALYEERPLVSFEADSP